MPKDENGHLSEETALPASFSEKLKAEAQLSTSKEVFLDEVKARVESEREPSAERRIRGMLTTLNKRSRELTNRVQFQDVGTVQQIGNGVASVSGLPNASIDEIVTFSTGVEGMALNLEQKKVDLIMLGSETGIRGGDLVQATGKRLQVPVGTQLLGRIINPLGSPLDRDEPIEASEFRVLSTSAPGIVERAPVNEPLFTGIKTIDALFPIGRGQRELILGDRQTGKTTLAVDAILSQKNTHVRCVYVAIGQKKSSTLSVIDAIDKGGVLQHTAFVIASPDEQPALRYLAPFTGITLAEYFLDQGLDVLIVFDDLSNHANAYRELSLLLRRPPGREAYPGDIFYLHARLLERACKLNQENGGGSITALPIAATKSGNISAYIPTNLISITDGQLMLDANRFNQGQKPAIDIGQSVSRVGGAAQKPVLRDLAGNLKLELSQYQEVENFTKFGTDVDETTFQQIERGRRILNTLKQKPHQPFSFPATIMILFALNKGFMDQIPPSEIEDYQEALIDHLIRKENKLLKEITEEDRLTDLTVQNIKNTLSSFNETWIEEKGDLI